MSEHPVSNEMKSSVDGRNLTLVRGFDAPPEVVFKAFSEPERLERWWGPEGWRTETSRFEFEPGGTWHFCMRCTDENQADSYGKESWGKAVYQEINPPERIIYVDTFSDAEGNSVEGMPETLVTFDFFEKEGETKLIVRAQFPSEEDLQSVLDMGLIEGFESQFNCLDAYLYEVA